MSVSSVSGLASVNKNSPRAKSLSKFLLTLARPDTELTSKPAYKKTCCLRCRVSTASGNQGKLEGIFPVREKSGNLAFLKRSKILYF